MRKRRCVVAGFKRAVRCGLSRGSEICDVYLVNSELHLYLCLRHTNIAL